MTRSKETPTNTASEGADSDTGNFLPAVQIKNASVGAVLWQFLSDFVNQSNEIFRRKRKKNDREILKFYYRIEKFLALYFISIGYNIELKHLKIFFPVIIMVLLSLKCSIELFRPLL